MLRFSAVALGGILLSASWLVAQSDGVTTDGRLWFVSRHPREQPWGKRVVRLPDPSVLAFFQRLWREAPSGERGERWLRRELQGDVYGLGSLLEARDRQGVPAPTDAAELLRTLREHLYVELVAAVPIRFEDGALRVLTDDDDTELCYAFFEDATVEAHRDALAFWEHAGAALPAAGAVPASMAFPVPADLQRLEPGGPGEGATFALCMPRSGTGWLTALAEGLPGAAVIDGVRLPELAEWLRQVRPEGPDDAVGTLPWPSHWLLLRAALGGGGTLGEALTRLVRLPYRVAMAGHGAERADWLAGDSADAHRQLVAAVAAAQQPWPAADGAVAAGAHRAHAFLLGDLGPMILFDDRWAASHPHLARSLLGWARGWDPLDALHHERAAQYVVASGDHPRRDFAGVREELGRVAFGRPTAVAVGGDRLWVAVGSRLSSFDLEQRVAGGTVDLGRPVAGLAAHDGRLFALEAEPDPDGAWQVREVDGDRLGPVFTRVRAGEPAGESAAGRGLVVRPGRVAVLHSGPAILDQDMATGAVRVIDLRPRAVQGLALVDERFVTLSGRQLLLVETVATRALTTRVELPRAPLAFAADARGIVTLAGGADAEQQELRRFLHRGDGSYTLAIEVELAAGEKPPFERPPRLRSLGYRLEGVRYEDLATLGERLRELFRGHDLVDPLGRPVEPWIDIALPRPVPVPEDTVGAVFRLGREAGFRLRIARDD